MGYNFFRLAATMCMLFILVSREVEGSISACNLRTLYRLPECSYTSLDNSTYLNFCSIHEHYIDTVRDSFTCDEMMRLNPICGMNLTVSSFDLQPYADYDQKNGLIIKVIEELLIRRCCLGCNRLQYLPKRSYEVTLMDQYNRTTEADILLPIYSNSLPTFTLRYKKMIEIKRYAIIAKKQKVSTEQLMNTLLYSTIQTWPLFLMGIGLAICAGTIVWLLETWRNKDQFPRKFPEGPFDGFWWAYVSMTTVGYGDRTPTSPAARMFAVLWILIGITVFNMYTASLTSVLSDTFTIESQSFEGKHVGVLEHVPIINETVTSEFARPITYGTLIDLKNALINGEVTAVAMEKMMATYFMKIFQKDLQDDYNIEKTIEDKYDNSIGVSTYRDDIVKMLEAYRGKQNLDGLLQKYLYDLTHSPIDEYSFGDTNTVVSSDHNAFILTIAVTAALSICGMIVGVIVVRRRRKRKHDEKTNDIQMKNKEIEN